jgi:hypothetical protein
MMTIGCYNAIAQRPIMTIQDIGRLVTRLVCDTLAQKSHFRAMIS